MHLSQEDWFYLFIFLVFCVIIFLLLREFFCWYWKINERISLLKDIKKRLEFSKLHLDVAYPL